MIIVSVTGSNSNVGKTTLIENLLRRLHGRWGVCKVTICSPGGKHRCPRDKDDTCGICNEDLESFIVETDPEVLTQQGKDTWRYHQAGAHRVVWVRSRREYLAEALETALDVMKDEYGLIFEGNHALAVLEPDVAVMALDRNPRYKASARAVLHKIDLKGEASDPVFLEKIHTVIDEKGHLVV